MRIKSGSREGLAQQFFLRKSEGLHHALQPAASQPALGRHSGAASVERPGRAAVAGHTHTQPEGMCVRLALSSESQQVCLLLLNCLYCRSVSVSVLVV